MFVRNESLKLFLKLYPVTTVILVINLLVYLFFFFCSFLNLAPNLAFIFLQIFGRDALALDYGWWWQVLTALFIHADFGHFLFNAFSIFIFAPALESLLGKARYLLIYLGTGLLSNTVSLLLEPAALSYGASTSIYGLFGVYLFLILFHREQISKQDQIILIAFLIINLIFSFTDVRIDKIGHFTGLLSGLLLAPLFYVRNRNNT